MTASRLLAKANIGAAVQARVSSKTSKATLTAQERDEMLSAIACGTEQEVRDRIRAIVELNKCSWRHSIKHLHDGRLTLQQGLGDSRK